MRLGFTAISAALLLLVAAAVPAQITNGGFEQPEVAPNSSQQFNAVSNGITGWTVTFGSVDVFNGVPAPFQGAQALDLDGSGPGTISQIFATTSGTVYSLDFAYSNNPFPVFSSHSANVSVDGAGSLVNSVITHNSSTGNSLAQMDYQMFHTTFTANTPSTTLTFSSLDSAFQSAGIVLDSVSVTPAPAATPEFGSAFSLVGLLSAGGLGLWVKRRRLK